MLGSILVMCDEDKERTAIVQKLRSFGYRVIEAESALRAIELIRKHKNILLAFLDMRVHDMDIVTLVSNIRSFDSYLGLILLTSSAQGSKIEMALDAGATDFMPLEVDSLRLKLAMQSALQRYVLGYKIECLKSNSDNFISLFNFEPRSTILQECIARVKAIAKEENHVFIEGEPGTNGQALAKGMHSKSHRKDKPFIVFSCLQGIDDHYKEKWSEQLEKKLQQAKGGTLCLLHIDWLEGQHRKDIDKILSLAKTKEVRIMGISDTPYALLLQQKSDLIAHFLQALQVEVIIVPPLRQCREDIEEISYKLLAHICVDISQPNLLLKLSGPVRALLMQHDWPGNIKELENLLFRAVLLRNSSTLELEDFPALSRDKVGHKEPKIERLQRCKYGQEFALYFRNDSQMKTIAEVEKEMIELALKHYNGQMSNIARRLGIGRSTLYRKIDEYRIGNPQFGKKQEDA